MKFFNRQEITIIVFVLAVISVLSYFNIRVAQRRARDFQRRDDVNRVAQFLFEFHEEHGAYPPASHEGKIIACGEAVGKEIDIGSGGSLFERLKTNFSPCEWGWDSFFNTEHKVPSDPANSQGVAYRYIATPDHFQILTSLEGRDEDEFNAAIERRNILCGGHVCNLGKASPNTPLDISLEEYENGLDE